MITSSKLRNAVSGKIEAGKLDILKDIKEGDFVSCNFYKDKYIHKEYRNINNMKENREASPINMDEAVECYYSGNKVLKDLALRYYSEEELAGNYEAIFRRVSGADGHVDLRIPYGLIKDTAWYMRQLVLAKYFNADWKPIAGEKVWYIGYLPGVEEPEVLYCCLQDYSRVYYKSEEIARRVLKII